MFLIFLDGFVDGLVEVDGLVIFNFIAGDS